MPISGRAGKRSERAISTTTAFPTSCFKTPAAVKLDFKGAAYVPDTGTHEVIRVDLKTGQKKVIAKLRSCEVMIEEGPVVRTGARFPIRSVYVRDPDGNLIEISERVSSQSHA